MNRISPLQALSLSIRVQANHGVKHVPVPVFHMDMDADSIRQMVESHIAACVLTDKGNNNEED